jgi:hypothetical protein
MERRQLLSYDDLSDGGPSSRYNSMVVQMRSPRKWRTFEGSSLFQGDILMRNQVFRAGPGDPAYSWVGKKLIQWDGESIFGYAQHLRSLRESAWRLGSTYGEIRVGDTPPSNIIHEYDIAKALRGGIYRIMWVRNGVLVSQPSVEKRPSRANIYVDVNTMIILGVEYY